MQSWALGLSSDKVAPNCGIPSNQSLTSVEVIFEASFLDIDFCGLSGLFSEIREKKEPEIMNLFARKFFALAAVVIVSGCASTSNLELNPNTTLSNVVISNIEVANETGESFEGIVVEEVLSQEIKAQLSALGLDSGSGAPATMKVNIIQYEKGNAVARWIMPGLGKTILSVEGEILGADGSLIASSQATETVGAGGLYTIGAWKQVFEKVARSLATDLAAVK